MGSSLIDKSLLDEAPLDHKQIKYEDATETGFMKKFDEGKFSGPCNVPGMCMEDHLEVFTIQNCRFSFFREHPTVENAVVDVPVPMYVSAYALPESCEYCHAQTTRECHGFCKRPEFYFRKKRPPFAKRNGKKWDRDTDYVLDKGRNEEDMQFLASNSSSASQEFPYDSSRRESWMHAWLGSESKAA